MKRNARREKHAGTRRGRVTFRWLGVGSLVAGGLCIAPSALAATVITLPDPTLPVLKNNGVFTNGNFYTYALPLVGANVPSNSGTLKQNAVVIFSGAGGFNKNDGTSTNNNQVGAGVGGFDQVYDAPSGTGANPNFSTGYLSGSDTNVTSVDTNTDWEKLGRPISYDKKTGQYGINPYNSPTVVGGTNSEQTWDADLSALKSFLTVNGQLQNAVFYFNHNQEGSDIDLWVWGQIHLTGPGGKSLYLNLTNNQPFDPNAFIDPTSAAVNYQVASGPSPTVDPIGNPGFPNMYVNYDAGTQTAPPINVGPAGPEGTDWVYTPGQLAGYNLNLGADHAAWAGYSPQLQAILASADLQGYDHFAGTFRYTHADNGYEQLFIMPTQFSDTPLVPLPASVWAGLTLLGGMGFYRLVRRRSALME